MIVNISIDTTLPSDLDLRVLAALTGEYNIAKAEEPKKAAPAAKKAPTPKAEPKAPEAVEEPEEVVEEVVEEPEEDLLGGDDEAVTMDQAVALATKAVSDGRTAEVKAALAAVGAKRVSGIAEDKLAEFVAELS